MAAGTVVQVIGTPGNSPALKYELQLVENTATSTTKGASLDRVNLCFTIFDDLIPKLGIFQRVMTMLRNEFQVAIFSDEYTAEGKKTKKSHTSRHAGGDEKAVAIKVPYFTIAKRSIEEKDKEVSKLKKQIHSLKEQFYTCEADLEKASSAIEGFKHDIKEYESRIAGLRGDLEAAAVENNRLKLLTTEIHSGHQTIVAKMENKALSLQNTVASQEVAINELKHYKSTHDKMQKRFSSGKGIEGNLSSKVEPFSIKASLEHEISVSEKLELQILQMQNAQIGQYELFLDKIDFNKKEDKSKLKIQREKFKLVSDEIDKELSLLRTHTESLKSRLNQLSSCDSAHPHKAIIDPNHPFNPLVTQEQPLNKYAAMLHLSCDNGVSYFPCKEDRLCENCGEKVIVCSHWSANELVIQLPMDITHIKFTRPLLHSKALPKHTPTDVLLAASSKIQIDNSLPKKKFFETALDPDISTMWKIFHDIHGEVRRIMPRRLCKEFLLKMMSRFYQSQLIQDKAPPTSDPSHSQSSLIHSFYHFLIRHYHLKPIALMVISDYLQSLEYHHQDNIYLLVLSHILGGTLEGVVFRYQLLYAELISLISWHSLDQFFRWASIVYSGIEEDEIEQLSIDYDGYCRSDTSPQKVLEFVTLTLIKHRDLSVKQAEFSLSEITTAHTGSMNEAEFAEACLVLCPKSDSLAMRLYSQLTSSPLHSTETLTSIRCLAYILGYVQLSSNMARIIEQLNELNIADGVTAIDTAASAISGDPLHRLITLSSLRDGMEIYSS